jgi:hypothetical protein
VRALGLILLVAACSPPGLTIEVVVDDPAMVKVELYAGAYCEECPFVTVPPGMSEMPVDDAFLVDDPRPFIVEQKDFSDGVAGFRIETPQDTAAGILVAVGYNAQNEIRWSWSKQYVEIPDADSKWWRIKMLPTAAIEPVITPQAAGSERAVQWPNPKGGPACLLLEHWYDNYDVSRELLGPADDPDCDGVAELLECAPWIPNAVGAAPTLDNANCVTNESVAGTGICMIGGPECSEDPTQPHDLCDAVEPNYCAPATLCQQCATRSDQNSCIRDALAMGTSTAPVSMPFVKCVIHVDGSGNQCDSTKLAIDLGSALSGSSRKCTGIELNDSDTSWSFNYAWHMGEGKLYVGSFDTPCRAGLIWEAGTAPVINIGVVDARIDNGYHLFVPIRVDISPGCSNSTPSACITVTQTSITETMFECAKQDMFIASVCAADPMCAAGPMCNGQCCGPGEFCGITGCSCGGGSRCSNGDTCENAGPVTDIVCGSICCGATTACPL